MNLSQIIDSLNSEIARLQQAKTLLQGEIPKKNVASSSSKPQPKTLGSGNKKRKISADGRARIAAAQKARWAKARTIA